MRNLTPLWISIIAAVIAAAFSGISALIAFLSLRLNQQHADRRQPRLSLAFQEGFIKQSNGDAVYALLIAISNPTDIDNSVVHIDLRIDYRRGSDYCARMDVPVAGESDDQSQVPLTGKLTPPVLIGAHQARIGWVYFRLNRALLADCKRDGYTIVARDTHGESATVDISVLREAFDAV